MVLPPSGGRRPTKKPPPPKGKVRYEDGSVGTPGRSTARGRAYAAQRKLDYQPTSGGGGKWVNKRTGNVVGTSKAEDAPIKKLGKPSKLPPQKRY